MIEEEVPVKCASEDKIVIGRKLIEAIMKVSLVGKPTGFVDYDK
jgi:hypothetical protein